jgi:hypothetical protein
MKKVVLSLIVVMISLSAFTQQMSAQERKALRKKEAAENLEKLRIFADERSWVIETHTVYDRQGMGYPVNSTLNFVAVVDDKVIVQLSFDEVPGWNGVGGITMQGNISKYEVKQKEGKPINITVRGSGAVMGTVDLQVSVNSSGQGNCTIRTATTSTRITFAGQYVNAAESRVYQGSTFN